MVFQSPANKTVSQSPGLGYVDDVTLGCASDEVEVDNDNIPGHAKLEEQVVIDQITDKGQRWERMLHTNGGLLKLP